MFERTPMTNFTHSNRSGTVKRCFPPDVARLAELSRRAHADDLLPDCPRRSSKPSRAVICVETGEKFDSFYAAGEWVAQQIGKPVGAGQIISAVEYGYSAAGWHLREAGYRSVLR